LEFVSRQPGCFVTNAYTALGLSGYKGDKLKEALLGKGLMSQQETRLWEGRRVAKTLALTPEGVRVLATLSSELPGKGGDVHRRLQGMIKEQAELLGWRATIEERMGKNGGQAD